MGEDHDDLDEVLAHQLTTTITTTSGTGYVAFYFRWLDRLPETLDLSNVNPLTCGVSVLCRLA